MLASSKRTIVVGTWYAPALFTENPENLLKDAKIGMLKAIVKAIKSGLCENILANWEGIDKNPFPPA